MCPVCAPVVHPAGVDAHGDSCHAEVLVETEPGHLATDHIVSCCPAPPPNIVPAPGPAAAAGEMHRWRYQHHIDGHKTLLIYHLFLEVKIKCNILQAFQSIQAS